MMSLRVCPVLFIQSVVAAQCLDRVFKAEALVSESAESPALYGLGGSQTASSSTSVEIVSQSKFLSEKLRRRDDGRRRRRMMQQFLPAAIMFEDGDVAFNYQHEYLMKRDLTAILCSLNINPTSLSFLFHFNLREFELELLYFPERGRFPNLDPGSGLKLVS